MLATMGQFICTSFITFWTVPQISSYPLRWLVLPSDTWCTPYHDITGLLQGTNSYW